MYTWHKAENITAGSLQEKIITEISIAQKKIAVLKMGEKVFAFAATCPHAGAPLCDGWIDAQGRIVCPLHKYRFDPSNGRNTSGEGYKLFTYPVEIKSDGLFIGLLS